MNSGTVLHNQLRWIVGVLIVLIIAVGVIWLLHNRSEPTQDQAIGGDTDEYGCLGGAGYSWDEEIAACVRSWELKEADARRAARTAIAYVGSQHGQYVSAVIAGECSGCYAVRIGTNSPFTKRLVQLQHWQVSQVLDESETKHTESRSEEDPPQLHNLGITFIEWDETTGKAGDFLFDSSVSKLPSLYSDTEQKIFLEFGSQISNDEGTKRSPEFLYILGKDTTLISPVSGTVAMIDVLYSDDYHVGIRPDGHQQWLVSFEHTGQPLVEHGDRVEVGQAIAPALHKGFEGTDFGWAELVVWKGGATEEDIIKRCPTASLVPDAEAEITASIMQFVADWEAFIGADVYDVTTWTTPGCLVEQMTEAEALAGIRS